MSEKHHFYTLDGAELVGCLHWPEEFHQTGVVSCHGMLSSKDGVKQVGLANRLVQMGHAVLRFDFSGRGESPGDLVQLTFSRQVAECQAAVAWLRRQGVRHLALAGSSLGGAAAILVAAQGGIDALATIAAVGRADQMLASVVGAKGLALWERRGYLHFEGQKVGYSLVEDGKRLDMLAAAGAVRCPWLMTHGAHDEVVPAQEAKEMHRASGGRAELAVFPDADHTFSQQAQREQLLDRLALFLDASLRRCLASEPVTGKQMTHGV